MVHRGWQKSPLHRGIPAATPTLQGVAFPPPGPEGPGPRPQQVPDTAPGPVHQLHCPLVQQAGQGQAGERLGALVCLHSYGGRYNLEVSDVVGKAVRSEDGRGSSLWAWRVHVAVPHQVFLMEDI
jgi:hypothetical protein